MKNGWLILCNALVLCEMFKTSAQTGKHLMSGVSEDHLGARFGAMAECHPISAKDQSRLHQVGKKFFTGVFRGYVLIVGTIWKGNIVVPNIEELENLGASEIHPRKLNAKEVVTPKQVIFFIPDRGWNSKIDWKRSWSPRIHSKARTTCKERRSHGRTSRKLREVSSDRNKR